VEGARSDEEERTVKRENSERVWRTDIIRHEPDEKLK